MTERREYFRVRTPARLSLDVVATGDEQAARRRLRRRHVPPAVPVGTLEDARLGAEARTVLDVLQRMCATLERIDQRLSGTGPAARPEVEVSLSASGIAAPVALDAPEGTLVEIVLELADPALPLIPALARTVRRFEEGGRAMVAFQFEDLADEDRERIVQLALREQTAALRARRGANA